jgi:hypothetical protein
MNAFEALFWMGCALIFLKIVNGADPKLWLLFGLVAGIGIENKHSTLIFGFCFVAGLLLTRHRRHFGQPWIWLGGLISLLIFLPNLVWEFNRHFPTIELLQNVQRSGRNTAVGWAVFLLSQVLLMNPVSAPLWIGGLFFLLRDRERKGIRVLGVTYVALMACMLVLHGRLYYPAPAYPMLFAAGAAAFQSWFERSGWTWLKAAYVTALLVAGVILAPFSYFPMLTVNQYLSYSKFMHLAPPRIENQTEGPLPQLYADQFGWKEMAQVVADAYFRLSAEDRKNCAIFGQNYGEAGAIDFFGAKMGLPNALSGHQSYFYWGPREYTGSCMIVMDDNYETLSREFESVEKVGAVDHPLSLPYRHFDVFLVRRSKIGSLPEFWPQLKNWN